ncbi:Myosin-9 [Frankliniella fusca]|uniref:Myosin-9 n=1 Tax=Frankliniella fusca TaxID=407009 RepID=A0AAE1LN81_9NEOP|nr:Myosin-9 [Frankliniella fusca]
MFGEMTPSPRILQHAADALPRPSRLPQVAYVIAFTVELWWIVESDGSLPAPAHLLCAGYFVSLVLCAVLLHGLTVRRSLCLVVWLVGVASLALPEAGMVLYMALQHWRLQSLYGLTEITCWACRLFINAVGVVSVQSLYSTWREESEVMRRLRDLNMSSTMSTMSTSNGRRGSVVSVNGVGPMVHLGAHPHPLQHPHTVLGLAYQNEGFVGSMSQLNGKPPGGTYAVPLQPLHATKLKRSASSVSRRSSSSCVSLPALSPLDSSVYGYPPGAGAGAGTLPMTAHLPPPALLPPPGPLHRADSASEFNAAAFDGMLAASFRGQPPGGDVVDGGGGGGGGAAPGRRGAGRGPGPGRAQSLVDLSRSASRLGDYWRVETVTAPSRPAPAPAAYMLPTTRSLDRRLRPRRAVSMADLGAGLHAAPFLHAGGHFGPAPVYYRDAYGRDFVYPAPSAYVHPGMLYKGASSKTSLGAASDDFRKYRDVAL